MRKVTVTDRIVFLLTAHIAGYKVVGGMQSYSDLTTFYYTVSFGMLILASLLLMLLGFEILQNNGILILAAFIPTGLSLGLINQYLPQFHLIYLIVSMLGMALFILARYFTTQKAAHIALTLLHGISGLVLIGAPLALVLNGTQHLSMIFVSIGGLIIGAEGFLLTFLKTGKPLVSAQRLYAFFPFVLFLASAAFVAGLYK